jgi:hypothetical protein
MYSVGIRDSGFAIRARDSGLGTRDDLPIGLAAAFDSAGTALQDVATAALVYERAVTSGKGIERGLTDRRGFV